jgi:hypothetical protein
VATRSDGPSIRDHVGDDDMIPATLPELGFTRQQAHEFKKMADLTNEDVEDAANVVYRQSLTRICFSQ